MQHLKNRRVKHISRPDVMFRCFSWVMAVDLNCAMKDFYSDQSVSIPVGKVLFLYLWGDLVSFWGSNKNLNKVLDSVRLSERSSTLAVLSLSKLQEFSQQKLGKSIYSYSLEESPPKRSPSDLHHQQYLVMHDKLWNLPRWLTYFSSTDGAHTLYELSCLKLKCSAPFHFLIP